MTTLNFNQPYLLSKGYRLRPRYQPDWTPSWKGTNIKPSKCEDSIDSLPIRVLDATRIETGEQVMLKFVVPSEGNEGLEEVALLEHFSTPPLRDHPSNHVVRCLDSFPVPGTESGRFVSMPLLTDYEEIPFYNIAEVHDMLQQLFDGLLFMHENNIAHRDIASANVMMDARSLYDEPFHPYHQSHSPDMKRLWFRDPDVPRLVVGVNARESTPEQANGDPYDPFLADVYQLGAVLRRDLIPKFEFLESLLPLAEEMTLDNPTERPSLAAARTSMNTAFLGIPGWKYRWPIVPEYADFSQRWGYFWAGLAAEVKFWLNRILRVFLKQ
ncbi:hypothetical protein RSAG8_08781, partial [Rhizoctonia solani AG-8 WAC10335]